MLFTDQMALVYQYMKKSILFLMMSLPCQVYAQTIEKNTEPQLSKNHIFGELWGNSLGFSLNYSRLFFPERTLKVMGRLGYGTTMGDQGYCYLAEVTSLIGGKMNVELGPGISYFPDPSFNPATAGLTFRLGFRYIPYGSGINFGFCTMLVKLTEVYTKQERWLGLSAGYSF